MDRPVERRRKIDPSRGARLGDGSANDNDRIEIGPTQLAFGEWAVAGLALPDLGAMRHYRWQQLVAGLVARDIGGLLMFDPLNIRYATDTTNMQLWNSHNPFRACLLCADGHMVMWEYRNAPFLVAYNPLVAELRSGASFFYNVCGDRTAQDARAFAGQVTEVMAAHAGGNRRLAVDKIMVHGLRALEAAGFEVLEGEVVTERARAVKGQDEIAAMRCAHHACEAAIAEMEAFAREAVPRGGVSEDDVWAELHRGNIRRGGEWIETRLLASGPRTNPWFQECGPRIVQENEILAFDTDLIGAYGICIDISRTWWIGEHAPRPDMVTAMRHARDHLDSHFERLRPGVTIRELTHGGHVLAPGYQRQKYSCKMHGVGLCDEWPFVPYPEDWVDGAFETALEPGMVLCIEALVSPEGGDFSIKIEDQVLITETGAENLTRYPFDPALSPG
ncbi:MAG: dimethylsulfonioproprionate lyase DddP [Pseudorhodobacter sp.]